MCGIFGVVSSDRDVARLAYFGLFALQHRGQESAGIAVSDGTRITALRDMGLVAQVFSEEKLRGLAGGAAIGHTRYSTTGSSRWANAQPLVHHGRARTVAVAHNGNLVNARELRDELAASGVRLASTSDTAVVAALLADEPGELEGAAAAVARRLRGAFSLVALSEGRLVALRDPHGFRPLCLGRLGGDPLVASESCSLDLLGAELEREVGPGELLVLGEGAVASRQFAPPAPAAACIFELVYLARPDSRTAGADVYAVRTRMGEELAAQAPVEAELVVPVPDSGTPAAIGFARAAGIAFGEGLIKNRYVGRTFIEPDRELREQGIRLKFNPLAEVRGRRLVVVDDSIVRGATMRQIVAMLREAGAREVHVRISSPPVVAPCFYGVDMAERGELVAAGRATEAVRRHVGASSLAFLSLERLQRATRRPASEFCRACFTGRYPTSVPSGDGPAKLRLERALAA